jgi:hypothetical protein
MAICLVVDASAFPSDRPGPRSPCDIDDVEDASRLISGARRCYWVLYAADVKGRRGFTELREALERSYPALEVCWNIVVQQGKLYFLRARTDVREVVNKILEELGIRLKPKDLEYLSIAVGLAKDPKSGCTQVYLVTCDNALYNAGKRLSNTLSKCLYFSTVKPSELIEVFSSA